MKFQSPALALLVASIFPVLTGAALSCASGAYIIVARGSGEPPGTGRQAPMADAIKNQIPGSQIVPLRYPAITDGYSNSVAKGVDSLHETIAEYLTLCPNKHIILMGYSQGAQVVGDTLCGTSEPGFNNSNPLHIKYAGNIAATVLMADPTFVHGLSYDVGTAKKNGKFPRMDTDPCMRYQHRLKSYCDKNDLFCSHGDSIKVHSSYVNRYGDQATAWAIRTFRMRRRRKGNSPGSGDGQPVNNQPTNGSNGAGSGNNARRNSEGVILNCIAPISAVLAMLYLT